MLILNRRTLPGNHKFEHVPPIYHILFTIYHIPYPHPIDNKKGWIIVLFWIVMNYWQWERMNYCNPWHAARNWYSPSHPIFDWIVSGHTHPHTQPHPHTHTRRWYSPSHSVFDWMPPACIGAHTFIHLHWLRIKMIPQWILSLTSQCRPLMQHLSKHPVTTGNWNLSWLDEHIWLSCKTDRDEGGGGEAHNKCMR